MSIEENSNITGFSPFWRKSSALRVAFKLLFAYPGS
jgi:hypothetical protein